MAGGAKSGKMLAGTTKGTKRVAKTVATTPRKSNRTRKEATPEVHEVSDFEAVEKDKEENASDDEVFVIKPIVHELTIDKEFLEAHNLGKLNDLFEYQGWQNLFQEEVVVDEEAIREFYQNLLVIDRPGLIMANFVVLNKTFIMTDKDLGEILGIPSDGRSDYVKGDWPSDVAKAEVILRVGEDESNSSKPGSSLSMGVFNRTLHRLFCASIVPRMQKHTTVNFEDYLVMDCILERKRISLPKLILLHMQHCIKKNTHGFPYPGFVKKILQHYEAYTGVKEVVMSSPLNMEAFEKVGWKFDLDEGWYNKKREVPAESEDVIEDVKPDISLLSQETTLLKIADRQDLIEKKLGELESKIDKLILAVENGNRGVEESNKGPSSVIDKLPSMLVRVEDAMTGLKEQVGKLQQKLETVTGVVVKDVLPLTEKKDPMSRA